MRSDSFVFALFGLAVVGIGVLWLVGEDGAGGAAASLGGAVPHADGRGELAPLVPRRVNPNARTDVFVDSGAAAASARMGSGSLSLTFIDDATGTPIPELRFAVFVEQPALALIELGTSDARGRARIVGLEHDLVLIETLRAPPHATSIAAAWLADDPQQSLELRVGLGGSVSGRVVDDTGVPVDGAGVMLFDTSRVAAFWSKDAGPSARVATRTDDAGAFLFEAMKSSGDGVWLIDGEARPESWRKLNVTAEDQSEWQYVQVGDGQDVRVRDFVVERRRVYAGVVLDAEGVFLPGALVSADAWRLEAWTGPSLSGPGQSGFEVGDSETLTDASGAFELQVAGGVRRLAVWAPSLVPEPFGVPALDPAGRAEGLVLRLSRRAVLEIELVDEAGERIAGLPAALADHSTTVHAFSGVRWNKVRFDFLLTDGSWERVSRAPQGDGLVPIAARVSARSSTRRARRRSRVSLAGCTRRKVAQCDAAGPIEPEAIARAAHPTVAA